MKTVSAQQAHDMLLENDALLIDVRTDQEFQQEHIPYALSIPLEQLEQVLDSLSLRKGQLLLFHCQKGKRGEMACDITLNKFADKFTIVNVEGGFEAWQTAKLPIVKANQTGPKISIAKQLQLLFSTTILVMLLLNFMGYSSALIVVAIIALMMLISNLTGFCGLAILLRKMPWNQ
jgi:rhodanese-related sulfurtransferase